MKVLLSGSFGAAEREAWREALAQALPEARWCMPGEAEAMEAEMAVVANPPPGSLRGLPKLRFVQSLWAGVDRLLADPTLPPDLPLARMVDPAMNRAMAETALWAVLSLHRGFFTYRQQQARRQWRVLPQRRADEVAVAVLGLGQMGRATALVLAHHGYRVAGWRREASAGSDGAMGDEVEGLEVSSGAQALDALLGRSDIVINLLPLTPHTRGLFDAQRLRAMRRGAALVNLARGAHVVEDDLLSALDAGQVGHAVLDVFQAEPLPPAHAFWAHPQVTMLPHAAAQTDPRSAAAVVASNLRRVAAGQPPAHLVRRERGY